jgi:hypothetical protein
MITDYSCSYRIVISNKNMVQFLYALKYLSGCDKSISPDKKGRITITAKNTVRRMLFLHHSDKNLRLKNQQGKISTPLVLDHPWAAQ